MWVLEATDPTLNLTFRLLPGAMKTMGRAAGADLVVDAVLVSRFHCRFAIDERDRLDVEDLGSTNGTWVNGRKVDRAPLREGDRVTIGRVEFLVKAAADEGMMETQQEKSGT